MFTSDVRQLKKLYYCLPFKQMSMTIRSIDNRFHHLLPQPTKTTTHKEEEKN